MVKIQVDSQGKALSLNGSILEASEGGSGRTISCLNKSGSAITKGNKVWVDSNNNIIAYQVNRNYFVQGNLTVNDSTGIVSNFSQSNYIKTTVLELYNNNWEMIYKIHTPSTISGFNVFACDRSTPDWQNAIGFETHFQIIFSSNRSSYNVEGEGSHSVLTDTDYWVKIIFNGSQFILSYSLDGLTYTSDITINSEYNLPNSDWNIGRAVNDAYSFVFSGTVNIKECKVKINDNDSWIPYTSNITESMQTGIADENIAINSSGNVKVL